MNAGTELMTQEETARPEALGELVSGHSGLTSLQVSRKPGCFISLPRHLTGFPEDLLRP